VDTAKTRRCTYEVKAGRRRDLLITTGERKDDPLQSSYHIPRGLYLFCPWDPDLLHLPGPGSGDTHIEESRDATHIPDSDDTESEEFRDAPQFPEEYWSLELRNGQALQLQPFSVFLLGGGAVANTRGPRQIAISLHESKTWLMFTRGSPH
jgi:hypothetical protein